MSVLARGTRMRIIALPLTARTPTRDPLVYYHFVTARGDDKRPPNLLKKATNKAAEIWARFGKAEGGWRLKTFQYGERVYDRLDFEELALSGLDPTLGPKVSKFGGHEVDVEEKTKEPEEKRPLVEKDRRPIALIHPGFHSKPPPLGALAALLEQRKPRHRRGLWTWVLIAPLTAPFAIIPVIPNLPFFFCVWRSWTHWKALKASEYLDSLLQRGAIAPEVHEGLDVIYAKYKPRALPPSSPAPPQSQPSPSDVPHQQFSDKPGPLLLTKEAVPPILDLFGLPESAARDMYRAIEQARQRTEVGS